MNIEEIVTGLIAILTLFLHWYQNKKHKENVSEIEDIKLLLDECTKERAELKAQLTKLDEVVQEQYSLAINEIKDIRTTYGTYANIAFHSANK